MEAKVRISGYNDYIAVDMVDEQGVIHATPFYIANGRTVEVHFATPSSERAPDAVTYDEWYERWAFKMQGGELTCAWLNGPCPVPSYSKVNPTELPDWKFQNAHVILDTPIYL